MDETITIIFADDHSVFREGLRRIFATMPDLEVVGEAVDGNTALALIRQLRPAVAILDISMPQIDGFAVARAVADEKMDVPIIFLTMHNEKAMYEEALNVGAKGYVLKDRAATDIRQCIDVVVNGGEFASADVGAHRNGDRPVSMPKSQSQNN